MVVFSELDIKAFNNSTLKTKNTNWTLVSGSDPVSAQSKVSSYSNIVLRGHGNPDGLAFMPNNTEIMGGPAGTDYTKTSITREDISSYMLDVVRANKPFSLPPTESMLDNAMLGQSKTENGAYVTSRNTLNNITALMQIFGKAEPNANCYISGCSAGNGFLPDNMLKLIKETTGRTDLTLHFNKDLNVGSIKYNPEWFFKNYPDLPWQTHYDEKSGKDMLFFSLDVTQGSSNYYKNGYIKAYWENGEVKKESYEAYKAPRYNSTGTPVTIEKIR